MGVQDAGRVVEGHNPPLKRYQSPRLWRTIRAGGWHPVMRVRQATSFQPFGGQRQPAATLVRAPGEGWGGRGVVFRERQHRNCLNISNGKINQIRTPVFQIRTVGVYLGQHLPLRVIGPDLRLPPVTCRLLAFLFS